MYLTLTEFKSSYKSWKKATSFILTPNSSFLTKRTFLQEQLTKPSSLGGSRGGFPFSFLKVHASLDPGFACLLLRKALRPYRGNQATFKESSITDFFVTLSQVPRLPCVFFCMRNTCRS